MEMNLDNFVRNAASVQRDYFKLSGDMIEMSAMDHFNPLASQWKDFFRARAKPLESPDWHTENTVVYEGYKISLRRFTSGKKGNPIVIVAPEAGHDSLVVDFGPGQSLVECALKNYPGDIYVVDKLPAGPDDTNYTIDDSIRSLQESINVIGEPVNFVGFCQGGWQTTVFTALFPESVKSLTVAAGPIDFHAGDAVITKMALDLPFSFFQQMVANGGGNMPGISIGTGFMMMNAVDRFLGDDINLFNNAQNEEFLDRQHQFRSWYHNFQPVPGKMYLDIVKQLFRENRLIKGELEILGRPVDLSAITQPIILIGGTKDDITPPTQVMAMTDYVSSSSIKEILVPAGHIGVFMGKEIIKNHWPSILKEIGSNDEEK